jgi:hypothetical protein
LLRGAWAKARLAAMQSGQTHVFRFEPHGNRFQIVALDSLNAPVNSNPQDEREADELEEELETRPKPAELVRLSDDKLPEGITFSDGNVASSAQLMATLPDGAEGAWSQPILFHPDGTTSDATLVLTNEEDVSIRVTLRGLTGISQTVDVDEIEEFAASQPAAEAAP